MAGSAIRPEALAAGLAVAAGMYIWFSKVESYCVDFDELWKEDGPIHIRHHPQEQAFQEAQLKLRSVDAANVMGDYSKLDLAHHIANEVAPKCDWEEISLGENERGKQVWDGFVSIANYTWDEALGENAAEEEAEGAGKAT